MKCVICGYNIDDDAVVKNARIVIKTHDGPLYDYYPVHEDCYNRLDREYELPKAEGGRTVDCLQQMINKQQALQERLGYDIQKMGQEERTAFIKEMALHMTDELHELLRELPYLKPWKNYSEYNYEKIAEQTEKAREEYVDMIHFALNIGLALGFYEAEDMCELYIGKNKVNHKRQEEGY